MSKQAIRVRATLQGHYGQIREEGDIFHIADEKAFSGRWMEHVDEDGKAIKNSPIHKRYDEWVKDKARAQAEADKLPPVPERRTGTIPDPKGGKPEKDASVKGDEDDDGVKDEVKDKADKKGPIRTNDRPVI